MEAGGAAGFMAAQEIPLYTLWWAAEQRLAGDALMSFVSEAVREK